MPPFLVSKSVLGTGQNLLCDGPERAWIADEPTGVLVWRGQLDVDSDSSLDVALKLGGHDVRWEFDKRYVEALRAVIPGFSVGSRDIPWHLVAPTRCTVRALKSLVSGIQAALVDTDEKCYRTFCRQTDLFRSLGRAAVDTKRLEEHITAQGSGGRAGFLDGFRPEADGLLPRVSYNRLHADGAGTKTGRLTVASGPQFLTLNREYRDILRSRWEGGSVWYLDYSSLEPRTFLACSGKHLPSDFYTKVAGEVLGDRGLSGVAKSMFLRRLYGASHDTMAADSGGTVEQAKKVARYVDEEFGVAAKSAELSAEAQRSGRVKNHFGFALPVEKGTRDNVIFNNWLQSTATWVSLLGFARMCRAIAASGLDMVPICTIHDALIVDVHPRCEKYVPVLARVGTTVPELSSSVELPVKCEKISRKQR